MRQFDCEFDRTLAAGIELWKRKDCGKEPEGEWWAAIWTPSDEERVPCCTSITETNVLDLGRLFYHHCFSVVHVANLFGTGQIQDMLRIRTLLIQGYESVIEPLWQTMKAIENATGVMPKEAELVKIGVNIGWQLHYNPPVVEPAK